MQLKKAGGRVYGATFTAAEKKAMNMEIQRQMAEYDIKNIHEVDAMILWRLHTMFGFGPDRLKKFYHAFGKDVKALIKRYELEDSDDIWLCTHMLKEYGIDLEEWEREEKLEGDNDEQSRDEKK